MTVNLFINKLDRRLIQINQYYVPLWQDSAHGNLYLNLEYTQSWDNKQLVSDVVLIFFDCLTLRKVFFKHFIHKDWIFCQIYSFERSHSEADFKRIFCFLAINIVNIIVLYGPTKPISIYPYGRYKYAYGLQHTQMVITICVWSKYSYGVEYWHISLAS